MKLVIDGHTYEGPEPSGTRGLQLYAAVCNVLGNLGFGDLLEVVADEMEGRRIIALNRALAGSKDGPALFAATFHDWKRDDRSLDASALAEVYSVGQYHEPWWAMTSAWREAGFFRVPGQSGPEAVVAPES